MDELVHVEVTRRVNNWSMAKQDLPTGGGWAPGFRLCASNEVREGNRVPILYGEADETDRVMRSLADNQRKVIVLDVLTSLNVECKCREMGMTRRTYYRFRDASFRKFWKQLKALRFKGPVSAGQGLDYVAHKRMFPAIVATVA